MQTGARSPPPFAVGVCRLWTGCLPSLTSCLCLLFYPPPPHPTPGLQQVPGELWLSCRAAGGRSRRARPERHPVCLHVGARVGGGWGGWGRRGGLCAWSGLRLGCAHHAWLAPTSSWGAPSSSSSSPLPEHPTHHPLRWARNDGGGLSVSGNYNLGITMDSCWWVLRFRVSKTLHFKALQTWHHHGLLLVVWVGMAWDCGVAGWVWGAGSDRGCRGGEMEGMGKMGGMGFVEERGGWWWGVGGGGGEGKCRRSVGGAATCLHASGPRPSCPMLPHTSFLQV